MFWLDRYIGMGIFKNDIFHILCMFVIPLARLPTISAEFEQHQQLSAIEAGTYRTVLQNVPLFLVSAVFPYSKGEQGKVKQNLFFSNFGHFLTYNKSLFSVDLNSAVLHNMKYFSTELFMSNLRNMQVFFGLWIWIILIYLVLA